MFINDPKRILNDMGAAVIWLGFNPDNSDEVNGIHSDDLISCSLYLCNAAEMGELNYYDKKVFKSIDQPGLDEPIKIYQYMFTLQSLINFAKTKNHKLVILDRKAKSDTLIGVEKPLSTIERNTLLTIIAAFCKYESIDPLGRGTSVEIMKMTDDLGAHIDDDTIRRWLNKIPDALKARMK